MIHTPKFPLQLGDRSLFEKADEIKQVIMFHLRNIVLTYPGEKISDPSYGIGIKLYLFETITEGLLNNIADRIENQINRYLPYLNIRRINVSSPPDSNTLLVSIAFEVPDLDIFEVLDLEVTNI
jgi:phage baseplate assembly protein W